MSEIVFRKATKADVSQIKNLWNKTRAVHEALDDYWVAKKGADKVYGKFISKQMLSKNVFVAVAEVDKKLIGYAYCEVKKDVPIYERSKCKLGDLFVEDDFRGRGVAKKLVSMVEEFARSKKATYLFETNGAANTTAKVFYDSVGLVPLVEMRVKRL